jgi:putative ABC transport system permease protein
VLLGGAGLGVVVLRNALERRAELALLLAVGWRRRQTRRLVLQEHLALLAAGLVIGLGATAVAVLPALRNAPGELPWVSLGITLGGVLATGLLAALAGAATALRGSLLESLRSE